MESPRVVILGLGNLLLKDDGIGVWLVRELKNCSLSKNVKVYDIGTDIFSVLSLLKRKDRLLVVDAVLGGKKSGTVYKFSSEVLMGRNNFVSLHDASLHDLLDIINYFYGIRSFNVLGIEPQDINWGYGLSPVLVEKRNFLLQILKKEIKDLLKQFTINGDDIYE